jgi:pSer/pThr/pTyr-binding forkhead associated (FHA) protein
MHGISLGERQMAEVTIQILDGVDRGKVFTRMMTPISIGREEGNSVQLNDERVSRYHAKIQEDQGQLVLTDLESTNGTRVNGEPVPLTILRVGDRIALGRSVLLVGSPEQIDKITGPEVPPPPAGLPTMNMEDQLGDKTQQAKVSEEFSGDLNRSDELKFQLNFHANGVAPSFRESTEDPDTTTHRNKPDVPARLSPAQAAQLAELLLYLHQTLASAADDVTEQTANGGVHLSQATWQKILRVEMELARFHYKIGHPE